MSPRYSQWQWLWLLPILSMAYAKAIGSQTPAQTEPVKTASAVGAALSRTTQAPLVSMESFDLLKRARGLDTCGYVNGSMLSAAPSLSFESGSSLTASRYSQHPPLCAAQACSAAPWGARDTGTAVNRPLPSASCLQLVSIPPPIGTDCVRGPVITLIGRSAGKTLHPQSVAARTIRLPLTDHTRRPQLRKHLGVLLDDCLSR